MRKQTQNTLANRIISTILIIILLRIGNYVPIGNVDQRYLINILNSNPALRLFFNSKDLILSVFTVGIIPNINASILIQLLTTSFSYFKRLQKEEGEKGRRQLKQYTRSLTLVFAIFQSLSIAFTLKPILFNWDFETCFEITLVLTTGSMIVLWLSDLITEIGIGNGSSIIIALNIVSALPNTLKTLVQSGTPISLFYNFISFSILIIGIIYLQEIVKKIPLVTPKQLYINQNKWKNQLMQSSYLPLKINQGGVMPLVLSSTALTFLTYAFNYVINLKLFSFDFQNELLVKIFYSLLNFVLIIIFSRFYSSLLLNPVEIAKELNKMGVTILNIRPGQQTASFLKTTLNRVSMIGSLFLAILVAISNSGNSAGFGLTSLIILIGVILDTSRQIQTLLI